MKLRNFTALVLTIAALPLVVEWAGGARKPTEEDERYDTEDLLGDLG